MLATHMTPDCMLVRKLGKEEGRGGRGGDSPPYIYVGPFSGPTEIETDNEDTNTWSLVAEIGGEWSNCDYRIDLCQESSSLTSIGIH